MKRVGHREMTTGYERAKRDEAPKNGVDADGLHAGGADEDESTMHQRGG